MKKIFTLFSAAVLAFSAFAADYEHPMVVGMGENLVPMGNTTITVDEKDGKYSILLRNFMFGQDSNAMAIGNITVSDLAGTEADGVVYIDQATTAKITKGDDPSVAFWIGPLMFPSIPADIKAQITPTNLEAVISLSVPGTGDINVYFGVQTTAALGSHDSIELAYSEPLAVGMGEQVTPQDNADIAVTIHTDGTVDFTLKNFVFSYGDGTSLAFGNVEVTNVTVAEGSSASKIILKAENVTANITSGDDSQSFWMGPMLFPSLPVTFDLIITPTDIEGVVNLSVPNVGDIAVYIGEETVAEASVHDIDCGTLSVESVYDLRGIKVQNMAPGRIYIMKMSDGSCRKVAK